MQSLVLLFLLMLSSVGFAADLTLEQALQNIDAQTDYIKLFIVSLCYVIGIGLCFSGVMKLKKYGTRTAFMAVETSLIGPLLQFFIGVALFYTPEFLASINVTLYGDERRAFATQTDFFTKTTPGVVTAYSSYIDPIMHLIQIIGLISFLRGWIQLSKVSAAGQSQPGTISKGITHIISGSLAVNIYQVFNVLSATLTGS